MYEDPIGEEARIGFEKICDTMKATLFPRWSLVIQVWPTVLKGLRPCGLTDKVSDFSSEQ